MNITAVVHNNRVELPVPVADGTEVVIVLKDDADPASSDGSFFDSIQDLVGKAEGLPADFAAQHDHYIHGSPKRSAS